jgi:exosortase A
MQGMTEHPQNALWFALLLCLLVLGFVHQATFLSIFNKWGSDAAFSHGFLIVPIALWLIWKKRTDLAEVPIGATWTGVLVAAVCSISWVVARGSGVVVLEQFAVVAMIPSLVFAVLGWPATRALAFPLGFLFFAVPFGRSLVPWLMQLTADLSTWALQSSGVPVWRSNMYISIPAGKFEVAKACSGLKFFTAGLALGALYAHLTYRTLLKRALCVVAFIVVPILLNSARVYITILVSHLTDMRFGPGREHIAFGMIFFLIVMFVMFWIGRRWHDDVPQRPPYSGVAAAPQSRRSTMAWLPVAAGLLVISLGPPILGSSVTQARAKLSDVRSLIQMAGALPGWSGPDGADEAWRPLYSGGIVEAQGRYRDSRSNAVDVFVAVYGLGVTNGAEMISYDNVIDTADHGSMAAESKFYVRIGDNRGLTVRERVVESGGERRLVWYWFVVGDHAVTSQFTAKALEAVAIITRRANSERIVSISTFEDAEARQRLHDFVTVYGECIKAGLSVEACSG